MQGLANDGLHNVALNYNIKHITFYNISPKKCVLL